MSEVSTGAGLELAQMVKQHERSSFFGSDGDKHARASWRGIVRKATAIVREHESAILKEQTP
jgi:hypothetical protein